MFNFTKALLVLVVGAGAATGAIISSPSMSVIIGGVDQSSRLGLPAVQSGRGSFSLAAPVTLAGAWTISSFNVSYFDDPFINYGMNVQNLSITSQMYSFTFSDNFVGGPYNLLSESFSDAFTDGNRNGAVSVVATAPATAISQPLVNGNPIDGSTVNNCVTTGAAGYSGSCNSSFNLSTFVITPTTGATGTFGVTVNFTLSPGDIYSFNGQVNLASSTVPEPATYGYMAAGLGLFFVGMYRRRLNQQI